MKYIKKEEVAEILGLSPVTILKMCQKNRLPHYKIGWHGLRFKESEIIAWVEARKVTPITKQAEKREIVRPLSLLKYA